MKLRRRLMAGLIAIVCMVSAGALATEGGQQAGPQLPWKEHTLTLCSVRVNPDHIVDNPAPESDLYVMIRFACMQGETIPIHEVIQNLVDFQLIGADGTEYNAAAYMPYAITFSERNGVFATAMDQPRFDLFFVLPVGETIDTYTLKVLDAELSLADEAVAALIEVVE